MRQTALQFEFQSNQSFANFFVGGNAEVVAMLQTLASAQGEQQILIWGETGSGKSHLLHAVCHQARQAGLNVFYLDCAAQPLPSPALLEGMEMLELVCLDNVQHLSEQSEWQRALFDFYNRHRQLNHRLVLSADAPPKFLPIELMDLKTRMGWGISLKLKALRDDELIDAFTFKARDLGFDVPPQVGRFLFNHFAQDQAALWQLLERIDRATLIEQRKLSIPFIKHILQSGQYESATQ
jgi:DnaA-homolog protein